MQDKGQPSRSGASRQSAAAASPYLRPLPEQPLLTGLRMGLLWRWGSLIAVLAGVLVLMILISRNCQIGVEIAPDAAGQRALCGVHDHVWLPLKGWLVVRGWPWSLVGLAALALLGMIWLGGALIGQPLLRFAHLKLARALWRNPKLEQPLLRWHWATASGRFRPVLLEQALQIEHAGLAARVEEAVLAEDADALAEAAPELLRLTLMREQMSAQIDEDLPEDAALAARLRRASSLFSDWVQLETWLARHDLRETLEPAIAGLRQRLMAYALEATPEAGSGQALDKAIKTLSAAPHGFSASSLLAEMALMALSREVGEETVQAIQLRHRLAAGLDARQRQIDEARLRLEWSARNGGVMPLTEQPVEPLEQGQGSAAEASLALAAALSLAAGQAGPYLSHLDSLEGLDFAASGLVSRDMAGQALGQAAPLLEGASLEALDIAPWALADALLRVTAQAREGGAYVSLSRGDHNWLDMQRRSLAASAARDPDDPQLKGIAG
ncbi:MAG: hypothetical protein Alpg2KO_07110 [Alphaproteobacteria bacterium]